MRASRPPTLRPALCSALAGPRVRLAAGLLASVALVVGCGDTTEQASPPGHSSSAATSTTSTGDSGTSHSGGAGATSGSSATPGGRMTVGLSSPVVLERSGGIAGRLDRLEVRPDGTYVVSSRGSRPVTRALSEARLAAVVNAVRAADLGSQAPPGPPTAAEADVFRYRLVAEGKTVVTTQEQAAGSVRRLLDVLLPLLS